MERPHKEWFSAHGLPEPEVSELLRKHNRIETAAEEDVWFLDRLKAFSREKYGNMQQEHKDFRSDDAPFQKKITTKEKYKAKSAGTRCMMASITAFAGNRISQRRVVLVPSHELSRLDKIRPT